jgi:hypothetical protein
MMDGISGSREPSPAVSALSGFDPGRTAAKLGKRQREVVLKLTAEWGEAPSHVAAKSLFYGPHHLVDHKHLSDNCWRLNRRGERVKNALMETANGN